MPALVGWDVGPQQLDEPVARDRARPSFEMQIQQNGEMLLGPEAVDRAAAHELGRSEKLELKLSDHLHFQPHLKGFRRNVLRTCRGRAATLPPPKVPPGVRCGE